MLSAVYSYQIKKVLFIRLSSNIFHKNPHLRNIRPPFELAYSMCVLEKEGFNTKLIDCWIHNLSIEELVENINEYEPNMIVVSCTTDCCNLCTEFMREVKRNREVIVVTVGQHASSEPETFLYKDSPIDLCIVGENDAVLLNLVERLNSGRGLSGMKGVLSIDGGNSDVNIVEDLESLPIINHKYFTQDNGYISYYPVRLSEKVKWGHILTSRGCPYECIFCSPVMRDSYGKKVRLRSVNSVIAEIKDLISDGVNIITFCDDNFTTVRSHVESICKEIIKQDLDIKWIAHTRADNLDINLMKLMKKAGCLLLRIGVESASERIIKILKKTEYPEDWFRNIKEIFEQANAINLPTNALFIIGSPSETKEDLNKSIRMIRQLKTDIVMVHYFTPYPGSEYYQKNKNKIRLEDKEGMYHYVMSMNFSSIHPKELKKMLRKLYCQYYLRFSFLIKHFRNYLGFYMFNPHIFKMILIMFFRMLSPRKVF